MSEHSRSIDLRHHSIHQDYLDELMRIGEVSSKDNTADILTKSLHPDLHTRHTTSLFPDRGDLMPGKQGNGSEQQESSSKPHPTAHQHQNMVTYTTPSHPRLQLTQEDVHHNPTLRQTRQQWQEHIKHHPEPQDPTPLPITSKQARHNPTLRKARKQWMEYLHQK
jgi:hypothetical protein